MATIHKDTLKTLTPIEIGGDYDVHLEETGRMLDNVQVRLADLLDEIFATKTNELISEWEDAYGIIPEPGASLSERQINLVNQVKQFGSLHKSFYITVSEQRSVYVKIEEPLQFIIGVDLVGDRLGGPHTWEVKMNESDQHRFPFIIGTNLVGDKLVTFDAQNSLESVFERLKPASSRLLFDTFNWGFENDFIDWIQGDAVTDAVTVRTGTASAKLEASGSNVLGPSLRGIEINATSFYQSDVYINITSYAAGNFIAKLNYYDNILGTGTPLQTETLFVRTATTAGFVLESYTIGQTSDSPDFIIPATAKAVDVTFEWDTTPTGIAYIDDFSFNFA